MKNLISAVILLAAVASSAFDKACDVKKMADDTKITLKGRIVKHLHSDYYRFSDETGELTVEIDTDDKPDFPCPKIFILHGETDKDKDQLKVEIDYIEDPARKPTTVGEIKNLKDGSREILRGKISAHHGKRFYTLTDSTGKVLIETDDDLPFRKIKPGRVYKVYGEVDRDKNGCRIEADKLTEEK